MKNRSENAAQAAGIPSGRRFPSFYLTVVAKSSFLWLLWKSVSMPRKPR